jgi:hypothetical protein
MAEIDHESDRELNDLMAKRFLADAAADTTLQQHFDREPCVVAAGAYHGAGGQAGAGGYVRAGSART